MTNNTLTSKSLLVLLCNANGIHNHTADLSLILHDKLIDIALISETHLINRTKLHISDYIIFRSNYPDGTAHGEAAIIIRSTILVHSRSRHLSTKWTPHTIFHYTNYIRSLPYLYLCSILPPNKIISPLLFEEFLTPSKTNLL